MSETKNIVILGASWAGLSAAHYFLRHILPRLNNAGSTAYHVYLVNPSSHFFWRVGSPRTMVSPKITPTLTQGMFEPIAPGFKQYNQSTFTFVIGTATSLDPSARTVNITFNEGGRHEVLPYYALIITTGTRTPTPTTSLVGPHTISEEALKEMQARFAAKPKSVIVGGGGPVGVENAGEIGEYLNGAAGFFSSRPSNPKAKVTLITASKKLLPVLKESRSKQAEVYLNRVGVDVMYNTRIESVTKLENGQNELTLANGQKMTCDVYIPNTGAIPNSEYLPAVLKNTKGYVLTNPKTLRVDAAGPRVYCVGDVGDYTIGGILNIYDAIPVVMTNIKKDLLEAAASTNGATARSQPDRIYTPNNKETQIVPVGTSKGLGAYQGHTTPSLMVYMIKGKEYMVKEVKPTVNGAKWLKEDNYKTVS